MQRICADRQLAQAAMAVGRAIAVDDDLPLMSRSRKQWNSSAAAPVVPVPNLIREL
jgi:hypothetical protein